MSFNVNNLKCAKSDIDYFIMWFNWSSNNFSERKRFGIQYEHNCYSVSLLKDKVCPRGIDFRGPRRLLSTENEKSCTQANPQFIINFL